VREAGLNWGSVAFADGYSAVGNREEGSAWLKKAADLGYPEAQKLIKQ
jgi:TPR repeat protein